MLSPTSRRLKLISAGALALALGSASACDAPEDPLDEVASESSAIDFGLPDT